MGQIIISENVTLDGVVQDPAGSEGFRHDGWVGRIGDRGREEAATIALEEAASTEAMLLGRRSYEFFAARWPSRTGELASRLNSKPKYVVSSTHLPARPRRIATAGPASPAHPRHTMAKASATAVNAKLSPGPGRTQPCQMQLRT